MLEHGQQPAQQGLGRSAQGKPAKRAHSTHVRQPPQGLHGYRVGAEKMEKARMAVAGPASAYCQYVPSHGGTG